MNRTHMMIGLAAALACIGAVATSAHAQIIMAKPQPAPSTAVPPPSEMKLWPKAEEDPTTGKPPPMVQKRLPPGVNLWPKTPAIGVDPGEVNMIGGPDPNTAAQGVGDTTETGTNPSGVDPITGKPPGVADAAYITALSHGAKAGAIAGGIAGTLTGVPSAGNVAAAVGLGMVTGAAIAVSEGANSAPK